MENCQEGDGICNTRRTLEWCRKRYVELLNEYYDLYNKYIAYKTDTSADKEWKISYAENTLRYNIESARTNLNWILFIIQGITNYMSTIVNVVKQNVADSEAEILSKSDVLVNLNYKVDMMKAELESKERQVSFTEERNRNRKIMMIALVLVNLFLVVLFYYYFIADSEPIGIEVSAGTNAGTSSGMEVAELGVGDSQMTESF
jgi:hypothetical protein